MVSGMRKEIVKMQYDVILADPPWDYGDNMVCRRQGKFVQGSNSASVNHYPSMKMREMLELPIPEMCADNCILFMWSTGPMLEKALQVGKAWGFTYRQMAFVWDKSRTLPGNYTITQCEFVLVFAKKNGTLPKRTRTNVRQLFSERPREHSRKPEYVQDMIDSMYPNATKLELFARRSRPGWDVWGNETTKFDQQHLEGG